MNEKYAVENVPMPPQQFPGGSRSRVNLAGKKLRAAEFSFEDYMVFEEWRAAHRAVLNTFQASLRSRTRGKISLLRKDIKDEIRYWINCIDFREWNFPGWMMWLDADLSLKALMS